MELNLKELDLTECAEPSDQADLFVSNEGVLGSFDLTSGVLFTYHEEPWTNARTFDTQIQLLISEAARFENFNDKLQRALHMTACWHELRHFHDSFCTPAGYSVLRAAFLYHNLEGALAREIVAWRTRSPSSLRLPLIRYFDDPQLPSALHTIVGLMRQESLRFRLNVGASPIAEIEGHQQEVDFYIIKIQNAFDTPCRIPCAYVNMVRDDKPIHVLWPIGFALLTELLATLEQGSWLACIGDDIRLASRELFRRQISPYLPLIATYVRILKRRGVSTVEDKTLQGIATTSLFHRDAYTYKQNPIQCCPWGWEFVRLIEDHLHIKDQTPLWRPPKIAASSFRENGLPIEAPFLDHIREKYFNPALEAIDGVDLNYATPEGYTYLSTKFPRPPLVITHDGFKSINDPAFYELWCSWVLNLTLIKNTLYEQTIVCPVLDDRTAWLFPRESVLPSGEMCRKHLSQKSCGIWNGTSDYVGPDCLWAKLVANLFETFSSKSKLLPS